MVVMQTDCFTLPVVHHFSAGGAAVRPFLCERVECRAGHVCVNRPRQGARGSGAGGMAFWCASMACFRRCMSVRWFRRDLACRVADAATVGCGDWRGNRSGGLWLFILTCGYRLVSIAA